MIMTVVTFLLIMVVFIALATKNRTFIGISSLLLLLAEGIYLYQVEVTMGMKYGTLNIVHPFVVAGVFIVALFVGFFGAISWLYQWPKASKEKQKGFTLIELMIILMIIATLVVTLTAGRGSLRGSFIRISGGCRPDYGTGDRIGYIVKLSQKGLYYKSWEGELQLGTGDQASLQSVWHFSVIDPRIVEEVQKAFGRHVRLHYKEYWIQPINRDTPYEITKVDILDAN